MMICGRLLFAFLLCLSALVYCDQSETTSVSNENVVRILSLLRSGDEKLNFAGSRDVILVLGNTGSGKSTFTQFLAGNNDELIAKEVGEGEYIIYDTHDRISNNTVISKTLIPEKVVNHDTKMVVYDCPGFGDSGRNEANDIAAAYFIKRVMENVKNIKIVLAVSYPSLRKGINRNDFFQLLEHVNVLIKHVEKYVDGVALIATKVDDTYKKVNGVPVLLSDGTVIENIAQFLLEVKESLKTMKNLDQVYKSESKRVKNEVFLKNSNRLLESLLEKSGTEYSRLSIFRRPDGPGRLSASKLLQREKKTIESMLKNRLKYVPVDVTDIGYAVSEKSKNVIWELETEIVKTISSDMARLDQIIVDHFENLERDMLGNDMYSLAELLKEASKGLARISSINGSVKTDKLVMHLRQNLPESCLSVSESVLHDMANLGKFYDFLQEVSDKKAEPVTSNWVNELQRAISYVENSIKWYDFLAALHQRLSEYDIQKYTKQFRVPKLGSASRPLGNIKDFTVFFNQISDLDFLKIVNLKELQKIIVDDTKARYFERVISSTLQAGCTLEFKVEQTQFIDDADHVGLQASGEYIMLSEVLNNPLRQTIDSLQIFAKHTVFIDADLTKPIDISIIAPRWVVIGSRTINLNGSPGQKHVEYQAPNGEYSDTKEDGDEIRNGHDGEPGNPGQSAGHFFGVGQAFKNIENLAVTAIGGKGGNGQNGGDGARGKNGASHVISNYEYLLRCPPNQDCLTKIDYTKSGLFNLNVQGEVDYFKYGAVGGRGGDAGRGGAGGIGGDAGSISLLSTGDAKPSIYKKVGRGEVGEFGLHGICGRGGSGGAHHKAVYRFGTWSETRNYVYSQAGSAPDGERGKCLYYSSQFNSNFVSHQQPRPRAKVFWSPPSSVISHFREKLMTNFNDSVTQRNVLKFYHMLQNKEIVEYDRAELIYRELATLEGSNNQLDPHVSRLLYDFLLQRIQEQYKMVENTTRQEDRKLLEFLALVVNSQLVRLENKSEFRQVFDLQSYLDLLDSGDLAKIGQFFFSRARDEIKSVENLVGVIKSDIFDTIERTTDEIIKLSEKDINNDLGDYLLKLKLFDSLKIVSDFLMLCGSLASADLALVNTMKVTSALPSILTTTYPVFGNHIAKNLNTLDETFEEYMDAVRSALSKERKTLKALDMKYDEICDQFQEAGEILQDRKSLLASQSYGYPAHFSTSDVVQHIREMNKALSNDPNVVARTAANKFANDLKLIEFSTRLYETFLTDGVNSSKVIFYIENPQKNTISDDFLEDRAARIDKSVSEFFDIMAPVRRTARFSLTDSLYKPDDLTALRSLVTQALGRTKLQIFKLIDQFEIDEDLQLMIENLGEAIDAMVSIYNGVLLSQHDRALFTSFHKHLQNQIELEDDKQEYLVEMITANALIYEYERLLDVYRKYISPFNVSALVTPSVPNVDRNHTLNLDHIRSNIAVIESNVKSLSENSSIDTVTEKFNSANQRGAFFKWKSQNYEESISKLLRGKRVALKATINPKSLQFLRFNNITLTLKSDDPEVQQSLDEDMSNFNVIMTHSGRSYFHVCGHTQLINQDSVRFVYKANESVTELDDRHASPVIPILSPYTTWIFQLKPVNENVTFSTLLPYRKTEITIELEGEATYVDSQNNYNVCQNILRNEREAYVTSGGSAESSKLIRKRRENTNSETSMDQFGRLNGDDSDPRFEQNFTGATDVNEFLESESIDRFVV